MSNKFHSFLLLVFCLKYSCIPTYEPLKPKCVTYQNNLIKKEKKKTKKYVQDKNNSSHSLISIMIDNILCVIAYTEIDNT